MIKFELYKILRKKSVLIVFSFALLYTLLYVSEIFIDRLSNNLAVTDIEELLEKKAYAHIDFELTYGYSESWESFFYKRFNIMRIFPLVLIIAFAPLFPYEYQCEMSSILMSTKNGKIRSGRAKVFSAIIITNLSFVLVTLLQTVLYIIRYGITGYDTSIQIGSNFIFSTLPFNYLDLYIHTMLLNLLCINLILLIILGVSIGSYNSVKSLFIAMVLCYGFTPEIISKISTGITTQYLISLHPVNSFDNKSISYFEELTLLGYDIEWIYILKAIYVFEFLFGLYFICNMMIKKQKYFSQ